MCTGVAAHLAAKFQRTSPAHDAHADLRYCGQNAGKVWAHKLLVRREAAKA